jgi:NAD(P)-dependent dehydrogenase (short-subunit alcohol dehydrogenase family)
VNNGSVTGLVGSPGVVANVATKHAVSGLTKSAALQYATQGIRVNAVAPGLVRTPTAERVKALHPGPQSRWCEPEEVAEVVIFLCSDGASHVTRHVMRLDGALKSFPALRNSQGRVVQSEIRFDDRSP